MLLLGCVLILTGCAGQDGGSETNPEQTEEAATAATPSDTPAADRTVNFSADSSAISTSSPDTTSEAVPENNITALLPDGWHILEIIEDEPEIAEGDLNKDGIPDIAAIIEGDSESEEAPPRGLMIAFGQQDTTYSLSIIADKAVLRADEGGIWGDPFDSMSIDRGSVLLKFYGGSNYRWYSFYRFRFQDEDWYLIGATLGSYHTGTATEEYADEEDYNLLTGDYAIKKADEEGNLTTTEGNRGKRELVRLKDFSADSEF